MHNPNTSQSVKKYYNFDLLCHGDCLIRVRVPEKWKVYPKSTGGKKLKKILVHRFPFWAGDLFGHFLLKRIQKG